MEYCETVTFYFIGYFSDVLEVAFYSREYHDTRGNGSFRSTRSLVDEYLNQT